MSITAGDALKALNLIGSALLAAQAAYAESRRLAGQAGVSKEDRDASDARYGFSYLPPPPDADPPE